MSMFDNYNRNCNPHSHYPPYNGSTTILDPVRPNRPYEEYNALGELIGYYWHYGDSINIEYVVEGEVTDVELGTYMKAENWIYDKQCKICLYDFRHDIIYSVKCQGAPRVTLGIDSALSKTLQRGVYYVKLFVVEPDDEETILFQTEESTLYVK